MATIGVLGLFNHGFAGVERAALVAGAFAVLLAAALAAVIARSLSRPLSQMTQAVQDLARGELVAMPADGGQEMSALAAALAGLSSQLGTKQNLLENTVESIRDAVIVADEHAVVVVANAAARRLLDVDRGFDSFDGDANIRLFPCRRRHAAADSGCAAGAGATRRERRRLRTRG